MIDGGDNVFSLRRKELFWQHSVAKLVYTLSLSHVESFSAFGVIGRDPSDKESEFICPLSVGFF